MFYTKKALLPLVIHIDLITLGLYMLFYIDGV